MIRKSALAALVAWVALANPLGVGADTTASTYRQAVSDTLDYVRQVTPGDVAAATKAAAILTAGTGTSQPEILSDFAARPPDFEDAGKRLQALLEVIDHPAGTADPALAQARLHEILAMSRYDALHRPPTPLERFIQWVGDRIRDLLRAIFGGSGAAGSIPTWTLYAVCIAIMAGVALVVFRSTGGRFRGGAAIDGIGGPQTPADFFAQADRLAGKGDRVGAIRALCAGVAATLAGERTWEGSPLTVREIFQRAPDPASLRPLLLPFEAAVYGGRDIDEGTYGRAAAVAARFRAPRVEQAA